MSDRPPQSASARFQVGDWRVEPSLNRLTRDGEVVSLENKTMDTLVYLADNAGEVVAADDIIAAVWGGQPMGDNPVYKCIAQLRKAFGDDPKAPRYIETIARRGYRLVANVSRGAPAAQAPSKTTGRRSLFLAIGAPLAAVALLVWLALHQDSPNETPTVPNSIAVLPFENLSGDADNELFCRGIAEEILNHLAEISSLKVVARHSAFVLDGTGPDLPGFAEQLGVRYLLTGSVRQDAGRFRVSVRLVEADGTLLWTNSYDRDSGDVLALQNEIAAAVVDGLALEVGETYHARRLPSSNFEAYTAYAKGRDYLQRRPRNWIQLAASAFERAIQLDPEFAAAYAGLAVAQLHASRTGETDLANEQALIDEALRLDPDLAEAHAAAGFLQMSLGASPDLDAAVAHLQRALELNPSLIDARNWLAISLKLQGRKIEAARVREEAIALDPLNPVLALNIAADYHTDGQLDLARHQITRVLDFPNVPPWAYDWGANLEVSAGRYDVALDWLRKGLTSPQFSRSAERWEAARVAASYADLGLYEQANELLAATRLPDNSTWGLNYAFDVLIPQRKYAEFQDVVDRFAATQVAQDSWPVWALFVTGSYRVHAGDYDAAIDALQPIFEGGVPVYNGPGGADDVYDPLHLLAFAYIETGQRDRAMPLLEEALAMQVEERQRRTRPVGRFVAREAVTHSLLGNDELAVQRMREAIDGGWRAWFDRRNDPSYADLLDDPRLADALERVRHDLELQRQRVLATDEVEPVLPILTADD